ncbi:uncharacterized protein [Penaeus vannamei]|uniref:uncharacterized protein n=1 Tax=Penaeus vannamei TaxID=6689 RepID=UPI00387F90D0
MVLETFSNEVKPLGVEVSWTKTRIQDFGDLLGEPVQRTNLRVFKALVFLNSSETWTLSCALESRFDAFCNRSLRQIMGYCWRDHVLNQQLHRETGTGPVTCTIRDRQLRLYGHLARFPQDGPAYQVISVRDSLVWRRPVERPRKS